MQTLLEELSIDETFGVLMGDPTNLPRRVHPQDNDLEQSRAMSPECVCTAHPPTSLIVEPTRNLCARLIRHELEHAYRQFDLAVSKPARRPAAAREASPLPKF